MARRDERGLLYFVGRKKEIIRRIGENISAAEVEGVLRSHPKVVEAAVVPVPDELRGEEVKAYIQLKPGDDVPPEEIIAFCRRSLAAFKVPRFIEYPRQAISSARRRCGCRNRACSRRGAICAQGAWDRETGKVGE